MTTDYPRILITGGLGYVGGRLASYLANTGKVEVIATTRRAPHQFPELSLPHFHIQQLDMTFSDEQVLNVLKGVHTVIHLAAANEIISGKDPLFAIEVNTRDAVRMLKLSEKAGVQRFIYFSTMHVYGSPLLGEIKESRICEPRHPYAITHKSTEDFVLASRELEGIVLRLSNSFGPPTLPQVDRWTLLVNDLCRMAVQKGALILRSDGSQLRDFITLTDVCRATEHLLTLPNIGDGLYNLGGAYTASVLAMTEYIQDRFNIITGKQLPISKKASSPDQHIAKSLVYHVGKLAATGFELRQDIEGELDAMIRFCLKHFSPVDTPASS